MPKIKKFIISALTALLIVTLIVSAVFFLPKKTENGYAMSDTNTVKVGLNNNLTELTTNAGEINAEVLKDFYSKLAGSNATLTEVTAKASTPANYSQSRWYDGFNANDIAILNKSGSTNRDVIVKFGGLEWTVVYLSLDRNGDPVATLWLKNSADLGFGNVQFSTWNTAANSTKDTNHDYVPNNYVTSNIRSKLNLGTFVSSSNSSGSQSSQSTSSILAPFTMTDTQLASSGKKSLMKYLDMPYLVPYQESESWVLVCGNNGAASASLNIPGDAYGIPKLTNSTSTLAHNTRCYRWDANGANNNFDYNSYTLYDYIVEKTGQGTKVNSTQNNAYLSNNMDLSAVGELTTDGTHWKKTSEWTDTELSTMRTWTDAESWAFDPIWLPSTSEPGWDQANVLANNSKIGIWKTTVNQRSNTSGSCWLRCAYGSDTNIRLATYLNSNGACCIADGVIDNANKNTVRPALHLNLKSLDDAAVDILTAPDDIEFDYTAQSNDIQKAVTLGQATWYDNTIYTDSVDITYTANDSLHNSENDTSKAGEYTVELKIKSGQKLSWSDATSQTDKTREITMTVKPAKITVTIPPNTGGVEGFSDDNQYVYHTDESSKHALKFPDPDPGPPDGKKYNTTYIQLSSYATTDDEDNVSIKYHVVTHDEDDHENFKNNTLPGLENSVKNLPDPAANAGAGWVEYTAYDSFLNVNEPKGYCVFFKITAPNHETKYGHFSVHIATETLTIYTNGNPLKSDPVEYGSADVPHAQDKLKELAEAIITSVKDQKGEERLKVTENGLDKDKFVFYLKNTVGGAEVHTTEDSGGDLRWDAGTYELWVKYVDPGKTQFISFTWNGARPQLIIKPQEVELTWTGNSSWESDKAKASDTVADQMDEFSWVYDGSSHAPTASFVDKYNGSIKPTVTVTGEFINAQTHTATANEVKNYTFTNGTGSKQFKIVKAKNGWKDGKAYSRSNWSVGGQVSSEYIPQDLFGNMAKVSYYKSYTDGAYSDQYYGDFTEIKTPTVFYVKVVLTPPDGMTDNYDSITEHATFSIIECTEHSPKEGEWGKSEEGHWHICKFCGAQMESEPIAHTAGNYDENTRTETEHWKVCTVCGQDYDRHAHEPANDGKFVTDGGDPDNHWLECSVCAAQYSKAAHKYTVAGEIVNPAKCYEEGEQEFSCECGKKDPVNHKIDKIDHTYEVDANSSDGKKWYTDGEKHWHQCSVAECGEHDGEVSHSKATEKSKAPNCTEDGHNEYSYCSVCKYEYTPKIVIPATGHKLLAEGKVVLNAATCTTSGLEQGTCSVCGAFDYAEIKPLGHQFDKEKIVRAATCTVAGEKIMQCSRDGCEEVDENTRTAIPAAHTRSAAKVAQQDATQTEDGWKAHYECEECGEFLNTDGSAMSESAKNALKIPALGKPSTGGATSDWLKDNWIWLVVAAAVILLLILLIFIITSIRNRRREQERLERERERDRQFETFMKMQMMSSYNMGGFAGGGQPDGAAALDGAQYALPPVPQEMMNAAVSAAVNTALHIIEEHEHGANPNEQGVPPYYGQTAQGAYGYGQPYAGQYGQPNGQYGQPNGQPEPAQPTDQPAQGAQYGQPGAQYGQPNGQPTAQQYSQPFITPEPPQPQQQSAQTAQSAQQQAAQAQPQPQPSQPAFTDNDGFYDSYKKPKYDDDDDEDD